MWPSNQKIVCPYCRTPLPKISDIEQEYTCCWQAWYVEEFQDRLYWTEGSLLGYDVDAFDE